ncbi:MAG: DUF3109 family protein [Cytophagales bacterium]|nr:DUF3109 family protein [Cytophagales bacterium]
MIELNKVLVSDKVIEEEFVCNIGKCKGACCVEGDLGAPLNQDELEKLEQVYEEVKPYLSPEGIAEIEKQGLYVKDWEEDWSTPVIDGKECAYAVYDKDNILQCGIELAYNDGKIDYKKPISCYLYPIRIGKLQNYEVLHYDQWLICSDACALGQELKVPVYKFLKAPLIHKYGEEWYNELCEMVEQLKG